MRWILVLVLVCGLGAVVGAVLVGGGPGLEIEHGVLLVDPEGSRSETWQRGRHGLPQGRRLRAQGATVVTVPGLRFALESGAAIALTDRWEILGGDLTVLASTAQVLGLERIKALDFAAQTRCHLRARGDRVDLRCLTGAVTVRRSDGRDLSVAEGEGVLGEGDRWVLRQAQVGTGYGEDFEEGAAQALIDGWFHGRIEERDDGSGQFVLASVTEETASTQRISLRRPPGDFNAVRRCRLRLWAVAELSVTCTWIDQAGQVVATETRDAEAGWQDWDLQARTEAGDDLPPGLRMGGWAIVAEGMGEGAALRLDHLTFTP